MGLGPVPATEKLLRRLGLTVDDIALVELNEPVCKRTLHGRSDVASVTHSPHTPRRSSSPFRRTDLVYLGQ